MAIPPRLFTLSFLRPSVSVSKLPFPYKGTSQIGLGPPHRKLITSAQTLFLSETVFANTGG